MSANTHIPMRHTAQAGRSVSDKSYDTLRAEIPALDNLFRILGHGGTPNFLDIMRAISEMVAFYTDPDLLESQESMRFFEMSGNFCRFCS